MPESVFMSEDQREEKRTYIVAKPNSSVVTAAKTSTSPSFRSDDTADGFKIASNGGNIIHTGLNPRLTRNGNAVESGL